MVLQNFIVSVQAVLPLFFMMMLGSVIRWRNWLTPEELTKLNNVVFNLLFPFLLFSNIYNTDLKASFYPELILFSAGGIFLTFLIAWFVVPKIEANPASCGAMIQSSYRSNFVLLGLPLVANIFPGADLGMTAIAIGILIPFYNVLAVITLETFRSGRLSVKRIVHNIITNPLILGCLAGLIAMPLAIPPVIEHTISQLSATATPMALILLGASFHFNNSRHLQRNLLLCTVNRLILVPGFFLPLAAILGFRGLAFATLLGIFATPCSVSSFVMAQQMESDGELAGATVVYSSFFSCFTMCFFIFLFKQLGVL